MSNQGEEGWYPECIVCDMGNLGNVVCEQCYMNKTSNKTKGKERISEKRLSTNGEEDENKKKAILEWVVNLIIGIGLIIFIQVIGFTSLIITAEKFQEAGILFLKEQMILFFFALTTAGLQVFIFVEFIIKPSMIKW